MADLPLLIQQMMQPGFYPHPVKMPMQLIQTHISFVLLTGDYAYKLKKPVNFGFLNFSTLELRRQFCQEEFRLNQRGASPLYLEILPVTKSDHQYQLCGSGEIVEYALKMYQFPQENLFITMFEQGKLTEIEMQKLAKVVAKFHAEAETNDYIRSFGEISQINQTINDSYQQTISYIGSVQSKLQYQETKQFTDNFLSDKQEIFRRRITNKLIKECHGDLHLRNICIYQNQILLFDCIEFNEPFRFVDVMYDVAFTVMDLEARQRKDLANAFLNTYIEQTGDWEGLQVLPLYLCRQAYVRAKVNSFLLDDPNISEDQKNVAATTASDYYRLAWEYTRSAQGKLILMSGLSGSGKSTVARYLARKLSAIQIRSDAVRKHLAAVPLDMLGSDDIYSPEMTAKTYSRLLALGITLAKQGFSVILDAKYDRQSLRQDVLTQAEVNNLNLQIIYCTAPTSVLRDRLNQRSGDIADATADLITFQQARFETFTETEQVYVKTIDTTQNWEWGMGNGEWLIVNC